MSPCCTAHLLRQIRRISIYWFCQHYREEKPILKTQTNLSITPKIEEKNYFANRYFLGTTTGKTEAAAKRNAEEFGGEYVVTVHKFSEVSGSEFDEYENIIIACPTRDIGELQSDWQGYFEELNKFHFSGKKWLISEPETKKDIPIISRMLSGSWHKKSANWVERQLVIGQLRATNSTSLRR